MATGELVKLDGLLLPVYICFADCCVRSARSKPLDLPLGQRTGFLLVFFRSAGFYTAISCQPKDKLTDILVDCVVSTPYRSVRKKKERNRKYYACNSEQLRKKYAGSLLNSIKHAKSIQLEAKSDFGKGCHTRSTEPYFYEAAYLYVRDSLSL